MAELFHAELTPSLWFELRIDGLHCTCHTAAEHCYLLYVIHLDMSLTVRLPVTHLCCSFLQRLEDFRGWAQLGFLACPTALQGVNAQALLSALLQDSFLLPLYGDVMMPLHALYQQHVAPALEQMLTAMLQGSSSKAEVQQQIQDRRQLVGKCYQAATKGVEAEHAARRRYICRVLQELLLCLQVRSGVLWLQDTLSSLCQGADAH